MRWDYPPLYINPVFPGLRDIVITLVILLYIIIIIIAINIVVITIVSVTRGIFTRTLKLNYQIVLTIKLNFNKFSCKTFMKIN